MVRTILTAAALLAAGEVRGETITIDDGGRHTFRQDDLAPDDRLVILDALVVSVEGAQFDGGEVYGRSVLNVTGGAVVNDVTVYDIARFGVRGGAMVDQVNARADNAWSSGQIAVADGGVIDSLRVLSGIPFISIEAGMVNEWSVEGADGVELWAAGYLFRIDGSWEDDTAVLTGMTGSSYRPEKAIPLRVPLPNVVPWIVTGWEPAGALRPDDCPRIDQPCNHVVDRREFNAVLNGFGAIAGGPPDVNYDDRVDWDDLNMVLANLGEDGHWRWAAPEGPSPAMDIPFPIPILTGDTDLNGAVGIHDLNSVLNNFATFSSQPFLAGDTFPFDGRVSIDDLNRVRNHFGETNLRATVPEPTTFAIALIAVSALSTRRGRFRCP